MNVHLLRRHTLKSAAALAVWLSSASVLAQPLRKHTLEGIDVEGKPVKLQAMVGRVVMVSFVTGDCAVCTSELKLIREFYSANKSRGFEQLVVSLDRRLQDYQQLGQFMRTGAPVSQRFPMVWRHHLSHRDSFGELSRTPTHIILDRQGSEVHRRAGGMQSGDWDELWTLIGG